MSKKLSEMTEEELREYKVPYIKTKDELDAIITELEKRKHDYGTCVYAISISATATFNYMCNSLGVTGFQSSCADLDIVRRTRSINGPFMLVDARDMLFPQYDGKVEDTRKGWSEWLSEEAKRLLKEERDFLHPNVEKRWKELAAG